MKVMFHVAYRTELSGMPLQLYMRSANKECTFVVASDPAGWVDLADLLEAIAEMAEKLDGYDNLEKRCTDQDPTGPEDIT